MAFMVVKYTDMLLSKLPVDVLLVVVGSFAGVRTLTSILCVHCIYVSDVQNAKHGAKQSQAQRI